MSEIIYLLVEGENDIRFMNRVIKPILKTRYLDAPCFPYSQETKINLHSFIDYLNGRKIDYYMFSDKDDKNSIMEKKKEVFEYVDKKVPLDKIIIVEKVIESWYVAGLNDNDYSQLKIKQTYDDTNNFTYQEFENIMPPSFSSMIVFRNNILKRYKIEIALSKNSSFNSFYNLINI